MPPESGRLLSMMDSAVDALEGSVAEKQWVETLVDCPGAQGVFTYCVPPSLAVQPGDIVSVPFGSQQVGAIAIRCVTQLPDDLDAVQVREIESVIHRRFFQPSYWTMLNRVADYYATSLMQVIRVALPTGVLSRSQRRVRLTELAQSMPSKHLSPNAQQLLAVLQASKTKHYSWQYLQRQVTGANRGVHELLKGGWVEQYLEPPVPVRPKRRQAVTLTVNPASLSDLSPRQQEILAVLRKHGGDLWLTELLQHCQTSTSTLKALEQKGYLVVRSQEVLRTEQGMDIVADVPKSLTQEQAMALAQIQRRTGFQEILLHGVTGSGKTEIYLQAISPILQQGRSVLVLVPEIGLTPQLTDRFRARFGNQVCVYHSALSEGERYDTWRQMVGNDGRVVIGTRSAVFAPLPNLGLIILDEEHDSSFKQDYPAPCYHARTIARWRAEAANCSLILGSATPSLESWLASQTESTSVHYLSLPQRVHSRPMPTIEVIDMRQELFQGNRSMFSRSLQSALQTLQEEKQQGILFIHRRGHSTFVSCRSCGYVMTCPHCDVSLTYHQPHAGAIATLRCHYCNHTQLQPSSCPSCESPYLKHFGSGTQRVTQELASLFPDLRLIRFDGDTTRTKGSHRALLTRFAEGEADVLVGTQMLTKGIDLPQVTLVGILAADGLLHFSDYRASERTFQILTQVAGRSGRGELIGRVLLQTYSPQDPVIQAVQRQDYAAFAQAELRHRKALDYPPYGRLILLRFSSTNLVAVQKAAERVGQALISQKAPSVDCLGPAPAQILRVANRYRWQLLLKFPPDQSVTVPNLQELRALCPNTVSLTIDVDPFTLG